MVLGGMGGDGSISDGVEKAMRARQQVNYNDLKVQSITICLNI